MCPRVRLTPEVDRARAAGSAVWPTALASQASQGASVSGCHPSNHRTQAHPYPRPSLDARKAPSSPGLNALIRVPTREPRQWALTLTSFRTNHQGAQ